MAEAPARARSVMASFHDRILRMDDKASNAERWKGRALLALGLFSLGISFAGWLSPLRTPPALAAISAYFAVLATWGLYFAIRHMRRRAQ